MKNEKINIYLASIVTIVVGILLIMLGLFPFKKPATLWSDWGASVVSGIGGTLISAGSVSILLEMGSIKGLIKNTLNDFFSADYEFKNFSQDVLNKIALKIAKERAKQNSYNKFNESLYASEELLLKNCTEKYSEYNHNITILEPREDEEIFKKRITIENWICNARHLEEINFSIMLLSKGKEFTKENIFEYIHCSIAINEKPLSLEEISSNIQIIDIRNKKNTKYDYQFIFKKKIECADGRYHINYEFQYDIPIEDVTQAYKITYPCKMLKHEFYIENTSLWRLDANAFTAFYYDQNERNSNFKVVQEVENNTRIEFDGWCLPGAGYVVTPTKKSANSLAI